MRKTYILLALTLSFFTVIAQDITDSASKLKRQLVSSEYDRNSMTIINLGFPGQFSGTISNLFKEVVPPDKFYNNNLDLVSVPFNGELDLTNPKTQDKMLKSNVLDLLNTSKAGQKIVSKWFNRQSDGTFNVDILKERGLYNADDSDLKIASASKRGEAALMDMGMGLVDNSYIVIYGFANLITMNQYYDKMEVEAKDRKMNGFKADLVSYLYKLDFNDSVAAVFFNDYWVSNQTANAAGRINAFEAAVFPLIPIKSFYMPVQVTQFNAGEPLAPKEQKSQEMLLSDLIKTGLGSSISMAEHSVSDFRVKALVYDVNPIAVKIGRKEGLHFDQRYFVYENRMTRKGDTYSKKIGVVKSMKVVDNKIVASGEGNPSLFYQIAGGKVDNLGMFVEQKNDAGLNLFLGTTVGGLPGATGRLEYYISRQLYDVVANGKLAKGLTSFKIYAEGNFSTEAYDAENIGLTDYTFLRWSVGLNKDFYPLHFLHWGPFLGYGMETATWEGEDDKISSDFIEAGIRAGINISQNIQLVGSINYYMLLTSEKLNTNGELVEEFDYKLHFEDRMGPGASIGIRIMF